MADGRQIYARSTKANLLKCQGVMGKILGNWVLTHPVVCKLFLSACWVWNLWCPLEWAGHQSSHSFLRLVPPLKGCHSQYLQLGMNHEDFTIAFRTCLSVSVKESKQGKKERCETQYEVCATECGGAPMTRHQETGRDKYRSELLWVWWEDCATRQPCPQFLSHFLLLKFSSYMWRDYRERGFWTRMLLEKDITVCVHVYVYMCIYIYRYIIYIYTYTYTHTLYHSKVWDQ